MAKTHLLQSEIIQLQNEVSHRKKECGQLNIDKFKYDVTDVLEEVSEIKSKIDSLTIDIDKLELTNKSCNLELSDLESKLNIIDSNIEASIKQKESVHHNEKIQKEINKLKEELDEIDSIIFDINDEIIDINGDIRIAENTIQTVNDSIDKLEFMEKKYEGYEYYLQCVKRDGIPYELISDVLPKLEIEINNILQPLVDFQILLNTDGKNINSYIAYGTDEFWPLELTSGMEKFISSVQSERS